MARKVKKLRLLGGKGKSTWIIVFGRKKRRAAPRRKKAIRKRTAGRRRPIGARVGHPAANRPCRPLTGTEKQDLVDYLVSTGESPEDAKEWPERGWFAAFDDYCTDSPGHQGRVIVALWPAAPEAIQSFIYHEGKLVLAGSSQW